MTVVTDPDDLDRFKVIVDPVGQIISLLITNFMKLVVILISPLCSSVLLSLIRSLGPLAALLRRCRTFSNRLSLDIGRHRCGFRRFRHPVLLT